MGKEKGVKNKLDPHGKFTKDKDKTKRDKDDKNELKERLGLLFSDLLSIITLTSVFMVVYFLVTPTNAYVFCSDTSIQYPYKAHQIQLWSAAMYLVIPVLAILLANEVRNANLLDLRSDDDDEDDDDGSNDIPFITRLKGYFILIGHTVTLFVVGLMATVLITEVGKRWMGRPK
jgi:hypothetical protein